MNCWLSQARAQIFQFFARNRNARGHSCRLLAAPAGHTAALAERDPSLAAAHRFIDRQTRGPYSLWVHEHTFTEKDNGTLVGDKVEYAVPGGRLVQKFFVAPDLERIFQYRHRVLEEIFQSPGRAAGQSISG